MAWSSAVESVPATTLLLVLHMLPKSRLSSAEENTPRRETTTITLEIPRSSRFDMVRRTVVSSFLGLALEFCTAAQRHLRRRPHRDVDPQSVEDVDDDRLVRTRIGTATRGL